MECIHLKEDVNALQDVKLDSEGATIDAMLKDLDVDTRNYLTDIFMQMIKKFPM